MRIPNPLRVSPDVLSPSHRRHDLRVLALSLAALATGCGAGEDASAPVNAAAQALSGVPVTCQDIKASTPEATDGYFTLYVGGDASLPWVAWCHGMAGTPAEYLPLERVGTDSNFAQYTAGGSSPGTTVRTSYTRLRIDPVTLRVDTADQRFSSSSGSLNHGSTQVTAMPLGVAMSCNGTLAPANIDLRGTPFTVATGQFTVAGSSAKGSTAYSEVNRVVNLSGGGSCGWDAPAGSFNPFNQSGAQLQLRYRDESRPSSCQDIKTAHPDAADGDYALFIDKDPLRSWGVYCRDMAGTPSDYLTLVQTGTSSNYSQYTAGGNSPGTDVRTLYTRLRINPTTYQVNTADQTFSTSTGSLLHGNEPVTSMPFAAAMGCSRWGVGNVDLRGTGFAVAPGQFRVGGVSASGSYNYSSGNQVVALSAYGGCGWVGPLNSFNPFNQNGMPLPLVYTGAL